MKIQCLTMTVRRITEQKRGRDSKGNALLAVDRQSISAMGAGVGCAASLKKVTKKRKAEKVTPKKKGAKAGKGKGKASTGSGTKRKKTMKQKPKPKEKNYPEIFYVEVPKTENGKVATDCKGRPEFVKEYGEYTCYHVVHRECWKKHLCETQKAIINKLHEFVESTPKKKKKSEKSN